MASIRFGSEVIYRSEAQWGPDLGDSGQLTVVLLVKHLNALRLRFVEETLLGASGLAATPGR